MGFLDLLPEASRLSSTLYDEKGSLIVCIVVRSHHDHDGTSYDCHCLHIYWSGRLWKVHLSSLLIRKRRGE